MKILIVMLTLLLSSCALFEPKIEYRDRYIEKEQFHPPRPAPLIVSLPEVDYIITPDNVDKVLPKGQPYVIVGYSWESYLTLAQTFEQIVNKFKEYETVLCVYRKDLNELACSPYQQPKKSEESSK